MKRNATNRDETVPPTVPPTAAEAVTLTGALAAVELLAELPRQPATLRCGARNGNDSLTRVAVPERAARQPSTKGKSARERARAAKHRGVYIVKPSDDAKSSTSYRLRFRCPESGKYPTFEKLTAEQARTTETMHAAAVAKWIAIQARLVERHNGAEPKRATDSALAAEIKATYFDVYGKLLSAETLRDYQLAVDDLVAWGKLRDVGIARCRQLTAVKLRQYRAHVVGRKQADGSGRSPTTVNNALKRIAPALHELAAQGKLAMSSDEIRAALRPLKSKTVRKPFCRPAQLRAILAACQQYDAAGEGPLAGRMTLIVLFVLLSGMRSGEARKVEWADVGVDDDGAARILVRSEVAKTKTGRSVYLRPSPLLAHLVSRASGRSGRILDGVTAGKLDDARWLIESTYGVSFGMHALRRTCGTYLTCSPGIFGGASVYMSAAQLGHTVSIAQKNYVGQVEVSAEHKTLEAALQLGVEVGSCATL